ncbi:MAG: ABC transporter permease, partial [Cytophagales bacterium]|nr:ABC transporter permease [Cytophagales bacterium]
GYPAGRWFGFDNGDVEAMKKYFTDLEQIAPRNQLGGWRGDNTVHRGTRSATLKVQGDYPSIAGILDIPLIVGRFINQGDIADNRKVAVIGTKVKELLFEKDENAIGEYIQIMGTNFLVVGVFTSRQSGGRAADDLQTIYIPSALFSKPLTGKTEWVGLPSKPGKERI